MSARVQLRRTKGWRKPAGAVVVARPSRWGNPWIVGDEVTVNVAGHMDGPRVGVYDPNDVRYFEHSTSRKLTALEAVEFYRRDLLAQLNDPDPYYDDVRQALAELADHDLACWCPLDQPCHADVLLELANPGSTS